MPPERLEPHYGDLAVPPDDVEEVDELGRILEQEVAVLGVE